MSAKAILELRGIHKHYGDKFAVQNLDLTVAQQEFVSLLGPSGCGKTTTIRMIAGYIQPTAGEIILHGRDVTGLPPQRRNIGMVFQDYALFPHLTAAKNVAYSLRVRHMAKSQRAEITTRMLRLVGLADAADTMPSELSGGMKQRVALARALAMGPELLLLDEPFSALDAKKREEMRQEVRRIHDETGITTILVTHDQGEAFELSDRVVLMNQGEVEQVGDPADLYHRPQTDFASDFIGKSTKIDTTQISPRSEDGTAAYRTTSGAQIRAHASVDAEGAGFALAIRPEAVELARMESAADPREINAWDGVVRSSSFFGPSQELRVYVEHLGLDLAVVTGTRARFHDWRVDDRVRVAVDPFDVLVIPGSRTLSEGREAQPVE